MTIREYYKNYKKTKKFNSVLSNGNDKTIKEFYINCISKNILPKDNVLAWHDMLMKYTEREDAIFWVRYYESGKKINGRWNTRRACKTEFKDGFSYVFVSNYDAHEIFNMVRLGVTPDVDEFSEMMKNYEFPLHFESGESCEERDIAAFKKIGSTRGGILTPNYWYLAHIVGIKSEYYNGEGRKLNINADRIYPRGEIMDWVDDGNGKKVRRLEYELNTVEKELVKAHFLRFVDPLNYYAAPGANYQTNDVSKIIGEAKVLNDYMGFSFADIYGMDTMKGFRRAALAKSDFTCDENAVINIVYGIKKDFSEFSDDTGNDKSARIKKAVPIVDMTVYADRKIGEIVNSKLRDILENGNISVEELSNLQTKEYSKKIFDINYPLLAVIKIKSRYYANPIIINKKEYYICKEWYERNKPFLVKWIEDRKI